MLEGILYFVMVILVLVLIVGLYFYLKKQVKKTSVKYNELKKINSQFYMRNNIKECYTIKNILNSKKKFDRFDFDKFFEEHIENKMENFDDLHKKVTENKALYLKYYDKVYNLEKSKEDYSFKNKYIPMKIYKNIESNIFEKEQLKFILNPIFCIMIFYTSPKGRNSYKKTKRYSYKEIEKHCNFTKEKIKSRESKLYQRKKMNDSLRYDIMQRDGFRCVLCGRNAKNDDVKLHVDHIIPISKNGKTVRSNLRTLCASCNQGKSNKYIKYKDN